MTISQFQSEVKMFPQIDVLEFTPEAITIHNRIFNTTLSIQCAKIKALSTLDVVKLSSIGKNVEWISRVTGYYSKIGSWNEGKKAELKDRHHSTASEF